MSNPHELEALTSERSVFAKLPQMPQHMSQLEPGLRLNLTIPNLIAQVEGMYRRYIIDHWQESARAILKQKVLDAQQVVAQLGTPVDELTVKAVMEEVWFQLDFQGMALRLCDESTRDHTTIYTNPDQSQTLRELSHSLQGYGQHTLLHRKQLKTTAATAMSSIDRWLDEAAYLQILKQAISQAFNAATFMRLARFQSLKEEIIERGIQRAINPQQIRADLIADLRPIAAMMRLDCRHLSSGLQDLEKATHTAVIQEVFLPLQQPAIFAACVPSTFPLAETAADQRSREKAMNTLLNLQHALSVIATIHIQVDIIPVG